MGSLLHHSITPMFFEGGHQNGKMASVGSGGAGCIDQLQPVENGGSGGIRRSAGSGFDRSIPQRSGHRGDLSAHHGRMAHAGESAESIAVKPVIGHQSSVTSRFLLMTDYSI